MIPSGCGVFGVIRKDGKKKIPGSTVVKAIEKVRHRGSDKGAGFATFNLGEGNVYSLKAFLEGDPSRIMRMLNEHGLQVTSMNASYERGSFCNCSIMTLGDVNRLKKAVRNINEVLWDDSRGKGRIYSVGTSVSVFKDVGYPADVARKYNVELMEGDMWLAHTRQPTNSPGFYPYWSHPFSTFNIAIVHNGDVSSFGANVEFLQNRGWESFVGTDSEVIAFLFQELLEEGIPLEEAVKIVLNPSRRSSALPSVKDYLYRNARLDGPFTAVIGYDSMDDLYLVGIADRSKFRPAIIGEDDDAFYVASEESEIREVSPNAKIWTLKPGSYFLASLKRGVISRGREDDEVMSFSPPPTFETDFFDIDAINLSSEELNSRLEELSWKGKLTIKGVNGQRFIGNTLPFKGIKGLEVHLYGVVGNSMANLNEGNTFHVHGNVQDDCCDTMHGGKVVVDGDARDVIGQTFQGGVIVVKGNAGNRVGIQMREYQNKKPYLIIGGMVDDYLGEYMAGGVTVVLDLKSKDARVGNFVGTGMVGGKIYLRGKVSPSKLGLQPPRFEFVRLLKALLMEKMITEEEMKDLSKMEYLEAMKKMQGKAKEYAKRLFEEKVGIPTFEYRELSEGEFKEISSCADEVKEYGEYLKEKFTVVYPSK
ncbi:Glutamine--fructose-6-phosphate aminotransferase [Sulfuracidifex tepidarius]|uniref:Glutamine--fructose-6-phosphate aminotransferase n=1 Tax=Sulfuracidifex tepidarius TaxID=1294262 RepID=A0A510DVV3_9CREN|nr:glutamate synthase [Sulfuracidifex tepidarius]BBG24098.1 Glutamine--fructose-6-phosphate aminotransferase [Sulfuracidifex tepidarius]